MGNATSYHVELDRATAKRLAGSAWNEALWDSAVKTASGNISRETFDRAAAAHSQLLEVLHGGGLTPEEKKELEKKNTSATKIQSRQRGIQGRKKATSEAERRLAKATLMAGVAAIGAAQSSSASALVALQFAEQAAAAARIGRAPDPSKFPKLGLSLRILEIIVRIIERSETPKMSSLDVVEHFVKPRTAHSPSSLTDALSRLISNEDDENSEDTTSVDWGFSREDEEALRRRKEQGSTDSLLDSALTTILVASATEEETRAVIKLQAIHRGRIQRRKQRRAQKRRPPTLTTGKFWKKGDVGEATHLVCHAPSEPFSSLVSALQQMINYDDDDDMDDNEDEDDANKSYNRRKGSENSGKIFFWIDIFSITQHAVPPLNENVRWLTEGLPSGVRSIPNAVLVLHPWHKPSVLSTPLAIWMAALAAKNCESGKKLLNVLISANDGDSFESALRAPTAELPVTVPLDEKLLSDSNNKNKYGHPAWDAAVIWSNHNLDWLKNLSELSQLSESIKDTPKGGLARELLRRMNANDDDLALKKMLENWASEEGSKTLVGGGRALKKKGTKGARERAVALFARAAVLSERIRGTEHPGTWLALEELAAVSIEDGSPESGAEAENALRILLRAKRNAGLPSGDASIADSIVQLGLALKQQGADRLEEAESWFRRALRSRRNNPSMGPTHPLTLRCVRLLTSIGQQRIDATLKELGELEKQQAAAEAAAGIAGLDEIEAESWRVKVEGKMRELQILQSAAGDFTASFLEKDNAGTEEEGNVKKKKKRQSKKLKPGDGLIGKVDRHHRVGMSPTRRAIAGTEAAARQQRIQEMEKMKAEQSSSMYDTSIELTSMELSQLEKDMRMVLSDKSHMQELWNEIDPKRTGKAGCGALQGMLGLRFPQLSNRHAVLAAYKHICYVDVNGQDWVKEEHFPQLLRNLFYFNTAFLVLTPEYNMKRQTFKSMTLANFRAAAKKIGIQMSAQDLHAAFRKIERGNRKKNMKQNGGSSEVNGKRNANASGNKTLEKKQGPIISFDSFCLWMANTRFPIKNAKEENISSPPVLKGGKLDSMNNIDNEHKEYMVDGILLGDAITTQKHNPFRISPPKIKGIGTSFNRMQLKKDKTRKKNDTKMTFLERHIKRNNEYRKRKEAREKRRARMIEEASRAEKAAAEVAELKQRRRNHFAKIESLKRGAEAKQRDEEERKKTDEMLRGLESEEAVKERIRIQAKRAAERRQKRAKKKEEKKTPYGKGEDWSGMRAVSRRLKKTMRPVSRQRVGKRMGVRARPQSALPSRRRRMAHDEVGVNLSPFKKRIQIRRPKTAKSKQANGKNGIVRGRLRPESSALLKSSRAAEEEVTKAQDLVREGLLGSGETDAEEASVLAAEVAIEAASAAFDAAALCETAVEESGTADALSMLDGLGKIEEEEEKRDEEEGGNAKKEDDNLEEGNAEDDEEEIDLSTPAKRFEAELSIKLKEAVEAENYGDAAKLKSQLDRSLSETNELDKLEALKQGAVEVEEYSRAQEINTEIRRLRREQGKKDKKKEEVPKNVSPDHKERERENLLASARDFAKKMEKKANGKVKSLIKKPKVMKSMRRRPKSKRRRPASAKTRKKKLPSKGLKHVLTTTSKTYNVNPRVVSVVDRGTRDAVRLFDKKFDFKREAIRRERAKERAEALGIDFDPDNEHPEVDEVPVVSGSGGINPAALQGVQRRRGSQVKKYPGRKSPKSRSKSPKSRSKSKSPDRNEKDMQTHMEPDEIFSPRKKQPYPKIKNAATIAEKAYAKGWKTAPSVSGLSFTAGK
eukprot:g5882.t1